VNNIKIKFRQDESLNITREYIDRSGRDIMQEEENIP
jgi:hypothetical protein